MSTQRGTTATYKCANCGDPFTARTALRLARAQIAAERDDLIECHGVNGVIPANDREGLAGVADLNAVLAQIGEALK